MSSALLAVTSRTRRTPYSPRVEALGVKGYTVYNHMLLPAFFRSREEDYRHLKTKVQLWDVSCERQVELAGPDAARLAQFMTPRNLGKAVLGQCVYAPMTDHRGGLVNDPVLLKLAEDRFWLSIADSDVLLWALGLAQGLGLEVEISEPEVFPLAVQGPKADDLMAGVFGEEVRAIRFFRFATLPFQGHPLVIARSGWSKQGGFEIYLDAPALALDLWDALWAAGEAFGVGPGCPNLIERIESGLLSYGGDMTRADTPLECGLERYCDLDSPLEFLGREALRAQRDRGLERRMKGLRIAGEALPACIEAWPVTRGSQKVGQVTSAVFSPDFESNLAFAMIAREAWEKGSEVEVETPAGGRRAVVCDLPFA